MQLKKVVHRAGIFKQHMGARNRVGKGILYRPAGLHSLAELINWNRFLGFINVFKIRSLYNVQSRNLKSRYGARNRFQEPSLELSSQATCAGGPVRQPMPT
jgi:hypothetical protein